MENVVDVQAVSASTTSAGAVGISRGDRRLYLANLASFLDALTVRIGRMLHGVSDAEMRAVFVEESPVVISQLPNPAERPRGRQHPLIALVKLAVASVRLQMRVLKLEADEAGSPDAVQQVDDLSNLVEHLKGMAKDLGIDTSAA